MVTFTADLSERAVLAACLNNPDLLRAVRLCTDVADFWQPRHEQAFAAMCDLEDAGVRPDPQTVAVELARRHQLDAWNNGAALIDLYSTPPVGSWALHAQQMRQARRLRSIRAEHERLGQVLETVADADTVFDQAAKVSIGLAVAVDESQDTDQVEGLSTWRQFVETRPRHGRWLAPGLLRKGDAVMLLAPPGAGKSTVSRQVCLCLAAGVHPFRPDVRFTPLRTLLIDPENAPDQVAEEAEPMLARIDKFGPVDDDNAWVWSHPQGFNIRKRADAQLLERAIANARPDVVAIGSLSEMYDRAGDDWDTASKDVQNVLKVLRARYGLALWLEHHSTRGAGGGHSRSPFGGIGWEKWPTHGRWLSRADKDGRVYRLEQTFRGDRGKRDLPIGLLRGKESDPWWEPVWDEIELEAWIDGRPA